ncbi:hypothetical protein GJ496_006867 [Pomphorhynchus laevis]|nr:hypothetical protein GJ496_006867 [Pomphorhynchus laevis]
MAASRRLLKELTDMRSIPPMNYRNLQVDDSNIFVWFFEILPENVPYSKGAFKVKMEFPVEYPFKPPKVTILTKIYHVNVDETGKICLPIITPENWKPAVRAEHIIQNLITMINEPQPNHPLRSDVADLYLNNNKKFMKIAEEYTLHHAEPRGADEQPQSSGML